MLPNGWPKERRGFTCRYCIRIGGAGTPAGSRPSREGGGAAPAAAVVECSAASPIGPLTDAFQTSLPPPQHKNHQSHFTRSVPICADGEPPWPDALGPAVGGPPPVRCTARLPPGVPHMADDESVVARQLAHPAAAPPPSVSPRRSASSRLPRARNLLRRGPPPHPPPRSYYPRLSRAPRQKQSSSRTL